MKTITQITKDKIKDSFSLAEKEQSKLREYDQDLYGFTGKRIKHVINNICGIREKMVYLELGVYRAATLIAANFRNESLVSYAVDDYTIDGKEGHPYNEKGWDTPRFYATELMERYKAREGMNNLVYYFNSEATKVDLSKITRRIDIIHYDLEEHHAALSEIFDYYIPTLDKYSILLIANWNSTGVREQYEMLKNNKKIEIELLAEHLSSFTSDTNNWYNGFSASLVKVVENV